MPRRRAGRISKAGTEKTNSSRQATGCKTGSTDQLQTHELFKRFAIAPLPPAAHGFVFVQFEQYAIVPFAGVPSEARGELVSVRLGAWM
jgi:hypothetical protein